MTSPELELLRGRVDRLDRRLRSLRLALFAACCVATASLAGACLQRSAAAEAPDSKPDTEPDGDQVLRVRGLVVVDERGVERVVIGAPAPDPRAGPRVAPLYGILINGPEGDERGGYGVMGGGDEAVLTLDARTGEEVFKVVANADAGASLFLMHQDGATVQATTYRGRPELELFASDGESLFTALPPGE